MKLKDANFTDQEGDEPFEPDPEYDRAYDAIQAYPGEFFGEDLPSFFADFAKAQGELQDAHKDQTAGTIFKYKYADLSQVLQIARPVLSKHGIGIIQLLGNAGDNVSVTTLLAHKGGAGVKTVSSMPVHIPVGKSGQPTMTHAQAVGSVSTYLRRYSVAAIVGITQTDTDAANGDPVPSPQKREKTPQRAEPEAPRPDPAVIRALMACEDMETLQEMWGKLPKAAHLLYEGVKNTRKDELLVLQADKEQAQL